MRLWHLASGKQRACVALKADGAVTDTAAHSVCFSSNGRLLACAGESAVRVWEMRDLREDSPPALAFASPVPLLNANFVAGHQVLFAAGIEPAAP